MGEYEMAHESSKANESKKKESSSIFLCCGILCALDVASRELLTIWCSECGEARISSSNSAKHYGFVPGDNCIIPRLHIVCISIINTNIYSMCFSTAHSHARNLFDGVLFLMYHHSFVHIRMKLFTLPVLIMWQNRRHQNNAI